MRAVRNTGRYAIPAVILGCCLPLQAQPELVTDRPDQTESAIVVPRGRVQLEAGWTYSREEEGGERAETHQLPGTLVRIGLADPVELRVGWTGFLDEEVDLGGTRTSTDGTGDAALGVKMHLREEAGRYPELAVLAAISLPTGDDAFTSDELDPSFRFAMAHGLTDRLTLGTNLGLALETNESDATLATCQYTASLGIGVSDRMGAFVELFGSIPSSASGGPANSFDAGITFLLADNLQFDVAGGVGLSSAADDWFVGTGIAVRFPH